MTDPAADPPPCILSYQFATAPSPLQVSGDSAPSPGMVNVWISAPQDQVIYCSTITVAVPVGTAAGEFSTVAPTLTPNTTRWVSSAAVMHSGADIGLDPSINYAIMTVSCPSSDFWKIDYELVFSVTTTSVNLVPDTFPFIVVEHSAPGSPDDLINRRTTFTLAKAPVQLYLDNFVTVPASSSSTTQPQSEFSNGEAIRLLWESNGSTFSLYQGSGTQPAWTGADTSYIVQGGATASTTFTIVAAMADTPGAVSATAAVTITNPAAAPRADSAGTLTVVETSALTGEAQLAGTAVGGRLTAAGPARLAAVTAPSITVAGPASMQSATMAALTVAGAVGGSGALGLAAATAGTITVNSSVTALVLRAVTPDKAYTASSDGFLVGTVWWPSSSGAECAARISGTCSGGVGPVYATGGNVSPWMSSKETWMWSNAGAFVLPVPKGATFSASVSQRYGTGAPTAFGWYPLARNAALQEVDLESAGLQLPADAEPVKVPRPNLRRNIHRVVDALGGIFGEELTPERRERVTRALEALVGHR